MLYHFQLFYQIGLRAAVMGSSFLFPLGCVSNEMTSSFSYFTSEKKSSVGEASEAAFISFSTRFRDELSSFGS